MPSTRRRTAAAALIALLATAHGLAQSDRAGRSPWGPDDQIGTLNMMTPESRQAVLARADARRVFDLSVDYFVGMPSWHLLGDPRYQHLADARASWHRRGRPGRRRPARTGRRLHRRRRVSMYTHTGTRIDALKPLRPAR